MSLILKYVKKRHKMGEISENDVYLFASYSPETYCKRCRRVIPQCQIYCVECERELENIKKLKGGQRK